MKGYLKSIGYIEMVAYVVGAVWFLVAMIIHGSFHGLYILYFILYLVFTPLLGILCLAVAELLERVEVLEYKVHQLEGPSEEKKDNPDSVFKRQPQTKKKEKVDPTVAAYKMAMQNEKNEVKEVEKVISIHKKLKCVDEEGYLQIEDVDDSAEKVAIAICDIKDDYENIIKKGTKGIITSSGSVIAVVKFKLSTGEFFTKTLQWDQVQKYKASK